MLILVVFVIFEVEKLFLGLDIVDGFFGVFDIGIVEVIEISDVVGSFVCVMFIILWFLVDKMDFKLRFLVVFLRDCLEIDEVNDVVFVE